MIKFKVGSLIRTKIEAFEGEIVDCEGIIVKFWETPEGTYPHAISLFVTFDRSFPKDVGTIQDLHGFKESRWELKK
tara:strand:- start:3098 stop:3325 length:228 start_codon:yes stop_codon:yes gene_type:complete